MANEKPTQTTIMIEPSMRKQMKHIATDLDIGGFSGIARKLFKAFAYFLGDRDITNTKKIQMITLIDDERKIPWLYLLVAETKFCQRYPQLANDFTHLKDKIDTLDSVGQKTKVKVKPKK